MASKEIGSVFIRVWPNVDHFRRDAQNKLDRQRDLEAEANVVLDDSSLEREKARAERKTNRRPIKVDAEVDLDDTLRGIERQLRHLSEMADAAKNTRDEVDRMARQMSRMSESMRNIEVGYDEAAIRRLEQRLDNIEASINVSTGSAMAQVEQFKRDAEATGVNVEVEADPDVSSAVRANAAMRAAMRPIPVRTRLDRASLALTMAGLNALARQGVTINGRVRLSGLARAEAAVLRMSRDRVIRMRVSVVGRGWQALRGGLRSLAALGDMDEMINFFESVIHRMDVLGSQTALIGTAIGSAINVGTHALGGLLVTLADVGRSFGLLAAAPAALLAAWAGFHTHRSIWQDFGLALEGDADALARIPANGQRAVAAIERLSKVVNRSIQQRFWGRMTDEIERFAETVGPTLERGLGRTSEIYGESLSGMLDLAQTWAESGQLAAAFSNINAMFEGVGRGAVDLVDAFVTVGMRGARLFPRLGHTIEQAFSGLNQWSQWAVETGRIERWINSAVDTVRQLGRVVSATGGMLQGLTQAFRNAGITGLPAFVAGMESARDLMQSPEWQFRMGNMFEGMAIGARRTWEGVREIASALYDAHNWARELAIVIGDASFLGLEAIADILRNPIFQRGTMNLFEGFRDMLDIMEPGFQYLANIMGEFGTLTGQILREMAPGVNTFLGIFSDLATQLGPLLTQAVGPLTDFIDNIGHSFRWSVNNLIIPAVSALLGWFNELPPTLQRFIALGAVASRWLPFFGQSFRRMVQGVAANSRAFGSSSRLMSRSYNEMLTSGRRYSRFTQGGLHAMQQATKQYQRTGQIIQAQVRPQRNLTAAVGLTTQHMNRFRDSIRGTADAYRRGSDAGRNYVRNMSPILGVYSRMRVEGARATDGIRGGLARAGQAMGRFVENSVAGMNRFERSMTRVQRNMANFRQGPITGIPRGLDFTAPLNANYVAGHQRAWNTIRAGAIQASTAVQAYATTWSQTRVTALRAMTAMDAGVGRMNRVVATGASGIGRAFTTAWSGAEGAARTGVSNVVGAVRRIPEATRGVALGIGRGINTAFDGMERGMRGAVERTVGVIRGGFQAVPGIVRAAATGAANAWTVATTTINTATRHVTRLAGGMFALMGGAPGLALIGIITAIGTLRRRAVEAEQSIQAMFERLREGDTVAVKDTIFQSMREGLVDLYDAGGDARRMLDDLADGKDVATWQERARVLQGFTGMFGGSDWQQAIEFGNLTQEGLDRAAEAAEHFGLSLEEAVAMGPEAWGDISTGVKDVGADIIAGKEALDAWTDGAAELADTSVKTGGELRAMAEQMAANGESFHDASDGARRFAEVIATVGDTSQSADTRIGAMRESLVMMGDQYSETANIAIESWNRQQESMRLAGEIAETTGSLVGSATKGMSHDVEDMSQRQVLALQLAQSVQDQAMAAAISAYDRARDSNKSHTEAVEAGASAYDGVIGNVQKFGEQAGLTGDEIEILSAEVGALGDKGDVELVLDMKNLAQNEIEMAYDGLMRLNDMGAKVDGAEWMAFIAANPDQAYVAIDSTTRALANFEAHKYIAELGARQEGVTAAIAEAMGLGDLWSQGEYDAVLTAITDMDDAETAYDLLRDWDAEWVEANLGTKDEATPKLEALFGELGLFERSWVAELDEKGGDSVRQVMVDIRTILEAFAEKHNIKIDYDDGGAKDGTKSIMDNLSEINKGDPKIHLEPVGVVETEGQLKDAKRAADDVEGDYQTNLHTYDGTSDIARAAKEYVTGIPSEKATRLSSTGNLTIDAKNADTAVRGIVGSKVSHLYSTGSLKSDADSANQSVGSILGSKASNLYSTGDLLENALTAKSRVDEIPASRDTTFNFGGNLLVQVVAARLAMALLPKSRVIMLMATGNVVSYSLMARSAVAALNSKIIMLMATGNVVTYALMARAAVAALNSKSIVLSASGNVTSYTIMAITTLRRLVSKRIRLTATGNATPFTQRAISTLRNWRSKTVRLTANGNAISFAQSAARAMRAVPNVYRRISVTSNAWAVASSAQRAINSVRGKTVTIRTRRVGANAEGALYAGSARGLVQQFASGGFKESHRAMIARPTTDYRVWAEPETGGEAYIPLASSKRARSTEIWKETGRRLGVYADGGITDGGDRGSSGRAPTFNITNNYPKSEPTSKTVARSMEQLGSGAGGQW